LRAARYSNPIFFLFFGAFFTVFLFSIAQYLQHRDRTFLWYALYLASLLLVTWRNIEDDNPWLYSTYYLAPWIWTKTFLLSAHFCFYTLFVFYFLKRREGTPTFIRYALRFILAMSLVAGVAELLLLSGSHYYESWLLYYGTRILLTAFSFWFLWRLWHSKGGVLTRIIFAGTFSALLGELVSVFLIGPGSTFVSGMGVMLEIGFFSLGLAYRSRLFRMEHKRLQSKHIRQLEENERLHEIERREEIESFKNRFYANITHEFRTPLTVLLGMTGTLQTHADSAVRNTASILERNERNLLRLVNQLLDLSKIESGALRLRLEQADVMRFIKITGESFASLAVLKKQQLEVTTDPPDYFMEFDADRLQQVLSNLIGNALKFTGEGGEIRVTAGVETTTSPMLCIKVYDNGPGIQKEALPHIFDRFYQAENEQQAQESSGLGLALVRELVDLMQGSVAAESRVGEGCVFEVRLPVPVTDPSTTPGFSPEVSVTLAEISAPQPMPEVDVSTELPLLLLVEDNLDLAQYLQTLLHATYRVQHAFHGKEGLSLALESLPDLVLSDVMMPVMDGFTFCQTLKDDFRTSHIPVVMLTARATVEDKVQGLRCGVDAWLTKPFDQQELSATLASLLESRRRLRHSFENGSASELAPWERKEHAFLKEIHARIEANLSEPSYDVPRLSQELMMSRMQLYRKLKALGETSPALFIRSYRLARAQELLKTTDQTVAEIAFSTGFNDPAYFSNCFRDAVGKTPSEWRQMK